MKLTEDYLKDCGKCTRLKTFMTELKTIYPEYHNHPAAAFGDSNPDLLIVGLAPGMHGANATGRPFTGYPTGDFLFKALYKFGFASQSESTSLNDGLELTGARITNAVKYLPPKNQPQSAEINTCNEYLVAELSSLKPGAVILALGIIAHKAVLKAFDLKQKDYKFGHNLMHKLPPGIALIDSYHCSRYNTQTKRLTVEGFMRFSTIYKTYKNA